MSSDGYVAMSLGSQGIVLYDLYQDDPPATAMIIEGEFREPLHPAWSSTNLLAAVDEDRGFVVIDPHTGETVELGAKKGASWVGWLPDGSGMILSHRHGRIQVLHLNGRRVTPRIPPTIPDPWRSYGAHGERLAYKWRVVFDGLGQYATTVTRRDGSSGGRWGRGTSTGFGQWDASGRGMWFYDDPGRNIDGGGPSRLAFLRHFDQPHHVDRSIAFELCPGSGRHSRCQLHDSAGYPMMSFAPDDSFVVLESGQSGDLIHHLLVVDLETGEAHRSAAERVNGSYYVAGWSSDFPTYPLRRE